MARGSQYDGERQNALEAAKRLAGKHGLSLEEAARLEPPEQAPMAEPAAAYSPRPARPRRAPDVFHGYQDHGIDAIREAKRQRDAAMAAARGRGLDREEEAAKAAQEARAAQRKSTSRARRNPDSHAKVLLSETSLAMAEIADITGLDLYVVVGMKLKLRSAA